MSGWRRWQGMNMLVLFPSLSNNCVKKRSTEVACAIWPRKLSEYSAGEIATWAWIMLNHGDRGIDCHRGFKTHHAFAFSSLHNIPSVRGTQQESRTGVIRQQRRVNNIVNGKQTKHSVCRFVRAIY